MAKNSGTRLSTAVFRPIRFGLSIILLRAAHIPVAFLFFFHFTVLKYILSSIVRAGLGWRLHY
jgi:hypothetical protein